MKTVDELRAEEREVKEKRARLLADRGNHSNPAFLADLDSGVRTCDTRLAEIKGEIEDLERRREELLRAANDPNATRESGGSHDHQRSQAVRRDNSPLGQARDEALRAIDKLGLEARAADRLESVVRRDTSGLDARYVAAVSKPDYGSGFGKVITGRSQYELTAGESDALRQGLEAMRAMGIGSPSGGGYAVPVSIDPSVLLTSDGAINPLRQVARTVTITTSEWNGVSSAGVTAAFGAEASEVADASPTLGQPNIHPERATCFIPYSYELGGDWGGLAAELARLMQDAKDILEAEKFVNGAGHGSTEPEGILTGATGTVAAGSSAFAVADLYEIQEALAPRFSPRASWLSSLPVKNTAYRLVAEADTSEPRMFNDAGDQLLGKPWREVSDMPATLTNGNKIIVYGDIAAGFTIVDRIGFAVEPVPHLFGASGRPTGQRGLLGWWRVSSGVVNTSALKVLETTA